MTASRTTPPHCPVCSAPVPPKARACPDCGADERTGWEEEATRYDGLDLPDEAFADEDAEAAPRAKPGVRIAGIPLLWWLVGLAMLFLSVLQVLRLM